MFSLKNFIKKTNKTEVIASSFTVRGVERRGGEILLPLKMVYITIAFRKCLVKITQYYS